MPLRYLRCQHGLSCRAPQPTGQGDLPERSPSQTADHLPQFGEPIKESRAKLNTAMPVVAVVEMGRRSEHRYVVLHPPPPASAEGKGLVPMSVLPPVSSLMMAASDLVDAQRPKPGAMLGAMLSYVNYLHPCFDIRHVGFEAEFFGDDEEDVGLPEYITASYEAAKDTAPIFIQTCDNVGFGAAHLLKCCLDGEAKTMEDYISEQRRRPEGSVFNIGFPICFAEGSFYMNTVDGRRDIRKLKLVVEITWLPADRSRPRIGDHPNFSG